MADIISTIGAAGDYATIASWMAAVATIGGPGDTAIGEIIDELIDAPHTTFPSTSTADAVILRPSASIRHKGRYGSGCRVLGVSNSPLIAVASVNYLLTIDGLELDASRVVISGSVIDGSIQGGSPITFSNLIIYGQVTAGGSNAYGIRLVGFGTHYILNCVIFKVRRSSSFGGTVGILGSVNVVVHNCIVADVVNYFVQAGSGFINGIFKNCISIGCSVGFSNASAGSSNNASDDGTAPGAGSITGIDYRDDFIAGLTGYPALLPGSSLIGAGVDVGTILDAAGNPFASPPSIGPLEYVATGGGGGGGGGTTTHNPFRSRAFGGRS